MGATPINNKAVSVAATGLNEVDDIDALVESLMRQTLAPAEVIIVDGGSADGTWEHLEAARLKYPTLVPIRDESCSLQRCPGPIARGRNVAVGGGLAGGLRVRATGGRPGSAS